MFNLLTRSLLVALDKAEGMLGKKTGHQVDSNKYRAQNEVPRPPFTPMLAAKLILYRKSQTGSGVLSRR
jgi:hypothetical protein